MNIKNIVMTEPVENIISRSRGSVLESVLTKYSLRISELVNFGSNIIKWDIESQQMNDEDLPPILFLRNFIEQFDAVSILIKESSVEPCKSLLRTALENLFYLEYLLEKDSINRSMSFLVWHYINNNIYLERLNPTSEEYKKIELIFSKDKIMNNQKPPILPHVDQLLIIGNKILNSPKYQPYKKEYDITKRKCNNNFSWYSLFNGPRNIRQLSDLLGHSVLYDGFFRNYSSSIHGTDIIQGKLINNFNDGLCLQQIRVPKNAQDITQNCYNLCFLVFKMYVEKRIPAKQPDFINWHLDTFV